MLDVAGLTVWGIAIRRWCVVGSPLPIRQTDQPAWNRGVTIATGLWVAFQLSTRVLSEQALAEDGPAPVPTVSGLQSMCLLNVLLVGFFVALLSRFGENRLEPFGITATDWKRESAFGTAGFLAALPAVHLILLVTSPLRGDADRQHTLLRLLREDQSPETIVWVAVTVMVMAPLAEEIVYRVSLQGALRTRFSAAVSIGLSSLLFAGVHGFPDSLALIPLAIVLGTVYEHRRSYVAVVVLHALFNATTLLLMLLG